MQYFGVFGKYILTNRRARSGCKTINPRRAAQFLRIPAHSCTVNFDINSWIMRINSVRAMVLYFCSRPTKAIFQPDERKYVKFMMQKGAVSARANLQLRCTGCFIWNTRAGSAHLGFAGTRFQVALTIECTKRRHPYAKRSNYRRISRTHRLNTKIMQMI